MGQINSWLCRSSRALCRPRLGHHSQGGRALVQDGQGAAVQSTPTRAPQVATRPQRGGAEPTRDPQPFRFLGRVDTVTAPVPSPPRSHPVWSPEPPVGIAPLPSPRLQRPLSGEDTLWRQCPPAPGMLAWSHWVSRWTRPVRWQGRGGVGGGPREGPQPGWRGAEGRGRRGRGRGGEVVRAVMWTERTGRPASLAGKVEQRGALRLERGRGEHAPQGW